MARVERVRYLIWAYYRILWSKWHQTKQFIRLAFLAMRGCAGFCDVGWELHPNPPEQAHEQLGVYRYNVYVIERRDKHESGL